MNLTFTNYRRPFTMSSTKWSESDKMQIKDICEREEFQETLQNFMKTPSAEREEYEDWELFFDEVVDVVNDESGELLYQIHFFDEGTAYMFKAGTTEDVGGASGNSFEVDTKDTELLEALHQAYINAEPSVEQIIHFE